MFIEIAGIDGSGQTTLAKRIADEFGMKYEHGPWFSSIEADAFNYNKTNSNIREFMFMQDRILNKHKVEDAKDIAIDGYIFRGLAYCHAFSNELYEFAVNAYLTSNQFRIPDIVLVINTEFLATQHVLKDIRHDPNADKVLSTYDNIKEGLYFTKNIMEKYSKVVVINNNLNNFDVTINEALRIVDAFSLTID